MTRPTAAGVRAGPRSPCVGHALAAGGAAASCGDGVGEDDPELVLHLGGCLAQHTLMVYECCCDLQAANLQGACNHVASRSPATRPGCSERSRSVPAAASFLLPAVSSRPLRPRWSSQARGTHARRASCERAAADHRRGHAAAARPQQRRHRQRWRGVRSRHARVRGARGRPVSTWPECSAPPGDHRAAVLCVGRRPLALPADLQHVEDRRARARARACLPSLAGPHMRLVRAQHMRTGACHAHAPAQRRRVGGRQRPGALVPMTNCGGRAACMPLPIASQPEDSSCCDYDKRTPL